MNINLPDVEKKKGFRGKGMAFPVEFSPCPLKKNVNFLGILSVDIR